MYIPKEQKGSSAQKKLAGDVEPGPQDPRIPSRFFEKVVTGVSHPVDPDLMFDEEDILDMQTAETATLTGSAPSSAIPAWEAIVGSTFTAALVVPPNTFTGNLGARVEAPGTRAIVTAWQRASVTGDMYTVTLEAPVATGPYQVVWMTDESVTSFGPMFIPLIAINPTDAGGDASTWPLIDPSAITPSVDEIASLDGTRAVDQDDGSKVGTFNDSTFPTADQVQAAAADAVSDVLAILPDTIDPTYWPRAKTAVKYLAAILIEQSYFRENAGGPSSGAVLSWTARFNAITSALANATDVNPAMRLV